MTDAEDLAEQSIDDIRDDVKRNKDDARLAKELAEAQLAAVKQANFLRQVFFWLAFCLAGATVATSITLVFKVLAGAEIAPSVAVAFISGLAVETIGILAIMAGYLFPREHRSKPDE